MHRQAPDVEIEVIVGAMADLVKQGKVKYIGLSEVMLIQYAGPCSTSNLSCSVRIFTLESRTGAGSL
ncbi:MAG: aldo/keto reductase [Bacteroidetes bacterium]|nr:aldo/keto reductase [Bacteroidota bacterium]